MSAAELAEQRARYVLGDADLEQVAALAALDLEIATIIATAGETESTP
jgi:hypothetical protein